MNTTAKKIRSRLEKIQSELIDLSSKVSIEFRDYSGSGVVFLGQNHYWEELDELKILHRNENVRDKAKKAITRIKGWRNQGSLISGVIVNKTITVKTIANEPDMNNTLSWLDKGNSDDRIVAKVLEVQNEFPASRVVLVTGDINLQNKAEAAIIEYSEI